MAAPAWDQLFDVSGKIVLVTGGSRGRLVCLRRNSRRLNGCHASRCGKDGEQLQGFEILIDVDD